MLMALCVCTIIRCLFSFLCLCFCFLWEASCSIYSGTAPTGGGLLANLGKVRPSRKCFWRPFRDGGLRRIGSRSIDFAMACWRNWKLNGEFLLVPMRRVVVWETGCCRAVCFVTAESDALWDAVLRTEVKINNHLQRKGNVIIGDHWTWEKLLLLRSWALVRFHGRVCLLFSSSQYTSMEGTYFEMLYEPWLSELQIDAGQLLQLWRPWILVC